MLQNSLNMLYSEDNFFFFFFYVTKNYIYTFEYINLRQNYQIFYRAFPSWDSSNPIFFQENLMRLNLFSSFYKTAGYINVIILSRPVPIFQYMKVKIINCIFRCCWELHVRHGGMEAWPHGLNPAHLGLLELKKRKAVSEPLVQSTTFIPCLILTKVGSQGPLDQLPLV